MAYLVGGDLVSDLDAHAHARAVLDDRERRQLVHDAKEPCEPPEPVAECRAAVDREHETTEQAGVHVFHDGQAEPWIAAQLGRHVPGTQRGLYRDASVRVDELLRQEADRP